MNTISKAELEKMMPELRKQVLKSLSPEMRGIFDENTTVTILDVQPLTDEGMTAVKSWIDTKPVAQKVIYL